MIGLVAFSFGLRIPSMEPGPSNIGLGNKVDEILHQYPPGSLCIVSQWEVTLQLEHLDIHPHHTVGPHHDGTYLTSLDVWTAAKREFEALGITEVIVVAQPFLHLGGVQRIIANDGFTVRKVHIKRIAFDSDKRLNTQPWTTSRRALLLYAIKRKLGGLPGHAGRQHKGQ